ncbi:MAG: hypothetical protein IKL59_01810 [Clostridia bacterium]|nr:hypothetical protein [Clostridia bacterium]
MKKDKIKTEKSKKLPRFGALDAFIILVVIVIIVGVFFRYRLLDVLNAQQNLSDYNVSFSVENVRYTTPDYINIGDVVYFKDSGAELGVITNESENMGAFTVAPASEMFTDSNGNMIEVHYPNETRVSINGKMICSAQVSETGGILINGNTYLAPGQTVDVTTELVTMTIQINNIEPKE